MIPKEVEVGLQRPGNRPINIVQGLDRVCAFLLAIGESYAGGIFVNMHDDEIKVISGRMAQLGAVSSETVEGVFKDFVDSFGSAGDLLGSLESTESLLLQALPKERVSHIMEEIRGPAGRTMWDKLGNVNEQILANYLKNEYPQTVSVVLSMVKPEHSARILVLLPEALAVEVVTRMLRMEPVQKDILERVERILRLEFMSNLARGSRKDSHVLVADIFNHFDRSAEQRFFLHLAARHREDADKVKAQMFTFNDLKRIQGAGIQLLLRNIEREKLSIALKGAGGDALDLFLSQMSERAAKMLREDIQSLGPTKLRDIDNARAGIVAAAKDLASRGEITIGINDNDRTVD